MTDEQIKVFLKDFVDSSLQVLEDKRIDNPLNGQQHQEELDRYAAIVRHLQNRLGTIQSRSNERLLNDLLRQEGIQIDKNSPACRKLRVEFTRAELEVSRLYRKRRNGNYNNSYNLFLSSLLHPTIASNKPKKLLSAVIGEYIHYKTMMNGSQRI